MPRFSLAKYLSQIHPLTYLLGYLIAIPTYAFLYAFITPHGFYAPYARYEQGAISDTAQIMSSIETAIRRSINKKEPNALIIGDRKLDLTTLHVNDVKSADGTRLSFRVGIDATGTNEFLGTRQYGWSVGVTVPDRPSAMEADARGTIFNRVADFDFSKRASQINEENDKFLQALFYQDVIGVSPSTPVLSLNQQEEMQFQRYLSGVKGDSSSVTGHFFRMIYHSAVVITTLGLGDIIPMTPTARLLVALEAISGIIFCGLFLNALAFRASQRI